MIPLFTSQQVRDADKHAIERLKIPGIALMENASRSIYEAILNEFTDLEKQIPVGIIAGKGNNGGDGFAVARHFINNGFTVLTLSIAKESELKGDALVNFSALKNLLKYHPSSKIITYKTTRDINKLSNCFLIIDAMLGTGTKGSLEEPYRSIITRINKFNAWKVAVDLPTGLIIDNASGDVIFKADLTVTLAELKRGLFYGKGYVYSGVIEKGYIGIGDEYFNNVIVDDYLIEPEDAFYSLPVRELDVHKYSAGKIFIIAGSGLLPGAAFYTANSVLKAGAGAAILAFPKSLKSLAQSKLDGAIVQPFNDNGTEHLLVESIIDLEERIKWADVVAIGPGLGRNEETQDAVVLILKKYPKKNFIVDADAVFALGKGRYKKINMNNKILTPHHKEFADMIGIDIKSLQQDLISIGKKFAKQTGAYLVLKGAPTIIFTPFGEALINSSGNPGMAKFGSGDVLTGVIAGILAQNVNVAEAIISSVYLHGLAADILLASKSELGINASDIMENIPYAIKFLEDSVLQSS